MFNQQVVKALTTEEKAFMFMNATALNTRKRLSSLKASIVELSKTRSVEDAKLWWKDLPNEDKALLITAANGLCSIPFMISASWFWKVVMGGMVIASYPLSKKLFDKLDEIEALALEKLARESFEEFEEAVNGQQPEPEEIPVVASPKGLFIKSGVSLSTLLHSLGLKMSDAHKTIPVDFFPEIYKNRQSLPKADIEYVCGCFERPVEVVE